MEVNGVRAPSYDRSRLTAGIVHIGVGNFHRAHQAVVIDDLLERGLARDFAICGVGVLPADAAMRDALVNSDGLYVLELRHPDGRREPRVIGSIIEYLFAPDETAAVLARLTRGSTRIVSLTITEGGYQVDQRHPDVVHDLAHPDNPRTAFGLIVEGLRRRRLAGVPPFTVMSCDNLPGNGRVARSSVFSFAQLSDPPLADWIADNVAFPDSMVDRITPATTEEDRRYVREDLGIDDARPVVAEPFFQWVVEDRFPASRPPFELAGVQVVDDVAPYELMKLRLLNASHQALAYVSALLGFQYVDEAMADPIIRRFVRAYIGEARPTLDPVPGVDLEHYSNMLLTRFSNSAIRDTVARLCEHTSDRIPTFLVPAIAHNLAAGRGTPIAAAVCASWARFSEGTNELAGTIEVIDALAADRHEAALREYDEPGAFLEHPMFAGIGDDPQFRHDYLDSLGRFRQSGVRPTLEHLLASEIDEEMRS